MFVDSHAHLEGERFDPDREQVLARARENGIETIVAIGSGTGPGSLDCGIELARKHDFIYATVGIHPHEAKLATDADFQELEKLAKRPKVIAWGEIGLDYFYDHSPRDLQQQVFLKQLQLARTAKLPVVIHCRPSEAARTHGRIASRCCNSSGLQADWAESFTASQELRRMPSGRSRWDS